MAHKYTQKPITISEYNKKIDRVIKKYKGEPIADSLIAMVEEASKWRIVGEVKKGKYDSKRRKKVG